MPEARDEGERARRPTRLPRMPLSEEVVADYQTQRLSLKAHPLAFLRASRASAASALRRSQGHPASTAPAPGRRRRPDPPAAGLGAKGVVFITIEDETGVARSVIWPKAPERERIVVMGARLSLCMAVQTRRGHDRCRRRAAGGSQRLACTSTDDEADVNVPIANADEAKRSAPGLLASSRQTKSDGTLVLIPLSSSLPPA